MKIEDRYEIDTDEGSLLDTAQSLMQALYTAEFYLTKTRKSVVIFDTMAHVHSPQKWSYDGEYCHVTEYRA